MRFARISGITFPSGQGTDYVYSALRAFYDTFKEDNVMKKVLCVFVTVIMLLSCMTACNFHSTVNDGFGNTQAKSLPKVEEMLAFLLIKC